MDVSKFFGLFYWIVSSLVFCVFTQSAALADGTITVNFSMESDYFKSIMTPDEISGLEDGVAIYFSEQAKKRFPFLKWVTVGSGSGNSSQLILTMFDSTGGACDPQPTISLKWSAILNGNPLPLKEFSEGILYQTCNPDIPTQELGRLQEDIKNLVESMLQNTATQKSITEKVLSKVPFASNLNTDADQRMLLLPVGTSELLASTESKMSAAIRFVRASSNTSSSVINMQPSASGMQSDVCDQNCTPVRITGIEVDTTLVTLPLFDQPWPIVLVEMLTDHTEIKVFMTEYQQDTSIASRHNEVEIGMEP